MKKAIVFLLVIIFTFCSCSRTDYHEIESRAIVSAIGVDKENEKIVCTMEIVKPKTEEKTAENQIITASGENFKDAINNISGSVSKNLFYSHCAVIALGKNLSAKDIQSVFDFCFNSNEFTLLLKVIATDNAKALLNIKPKNEDVLGYEIMSVLNSRQKNLSIGYNNSFINVGGRRDTLPTLYALPFFEISGKDDKGLYSLKGLKFYLNDDETITLFKDKAVFFEALSNSFKSGQLSVNINNKTEILEIKKSATNIKVNFNKGLLKIDLLLEQTVKNKNNEININEYKKAATVLANQLIQISKTHGLDLFFIKEHLKREDKNIFNLVSGNFEEIYKNAVITFGVNIKEEK